MSLPKTIEDWNQSPWDKVSHTLLGLLFAAPIFYLTGGDPLVSTIAGGYMLYGREQAQDEKNSGYVKAWFPWFWKKDGILDVAIPVAIMYPVLYGVDKLEVLSWLKHFV